MVKAQEIPTQRVPADLYEAMLSHRNPGERVIWCGQPNPRRVLRLHSYVVVIYASQLLLAIGRLLSPGTSHGQSLYLLNLLLLILTLCLSTFPIWIWRQAKQTAYAVTNRQLLTATRNARGKITVKAYVPCYSEVARCVELPDGSGDLYYPNPDKQVNARTYINQPSGSFLGIPNVRAVEQQLQDTFGPAPRSAGNRSGSSA